MPGNTDLLKITLFERPDGDRPFTALILLLTGVFVLALQDSLVKLMSSETSFWQFQTLRSIGNVSFVILLALAGGGMRLLVAKNWKPVYLRAVFLIICMFFFFSGSPRLSVSQMAAGLYTYPLFVSLFAAPVLGEKIGIWRITALVSGAVGAIAILSPWDEDFSSIQILPVIAGFFYACNILTLRRACKEESPLALAFATGIVYVVTGIAGIVVLSILPISEEIRLSMPFVAIGWPELSLLVVGFAALASVLNLAGNISLSRAYQTADSSWLAPLDFTYLLFAAVWSRILFEQWPTTMAVIGMLLIATAGAMTAWRENVNR